MNECKKHVFAILHSAAKNIFKVFCNHLPLLQKTQTMFFAILQKLLQKTCFMFLPPVAKNTIL